MEKLKVGDKVYSESSQRWGRESGYLVAYVVRLTKTQAVLSCGTKLINDVVTDFNKKECFSEYGDRWNKWYIQTPEFRDIYSSWREKRIIEIWFDNKKFTYEEKKQIYNELNKDN